MKFAVVPFGLMTVLLVSSAFAQADVDVELAAVSVFNNAIAEIELSVSGNGVSRGLQIRFDFDDSNIAGIDLDDCLENFIGLEEPGTRCSKPGGQSGTVRILLDAGPGNAINDFTGVLRFQLDGTMPPGSLIDLSWDQNFAAATNPAAATAQTDGQIEVLGPAPGELALSPMAIDFGGVQIGNLDDATVTATNIATAESQPLEIASINLSGDADFELTGNGTCEVGSVLVPEGPGCQMEIAFAPGSSGDMNGILTVASVGGKQRHAGFAGEGLPIPATVLLSDLVQVYTGQPLAPTVATDPPGLDVIVSYDGQPGPPVDAGTYAVEVMVEDPVYSGEGNALFEILNNEILRDRFEAPTVNTPP